MGDSIFYYHYFLRQTHKSSHEILVIKKNANTPLSAATHTDYEIVQTDFECVCPCILYGADTVSLRAMERIIFFTQCGMHCFSKGNMRIAVNQFIGSSTHLFHV